MTKKNTTKHASEKRVSASEIIEQIRSNPSSMFRMGQKFELLVKHYFLKDPSFFVERAWLWNEWPDRNGEIDIGIDVVAETTDGRLLAIQCKMYGDGTPIDQDKVSQFIAAATRTFSNGARFSTGFLVATTDNITKRARDSLAGEREHIGFSIIDSHHLDNSAVDFTDQSLDNPETLELKPKYKPMDHQVAAIQAILDGFKDRDRGKLIMACGTGKTLTSLRLAEKMVPPGGSVLFLAPSISLVKQTLEVWRAQSFDPIYAIPVCADSKVSEDDISVYDLSIPATTNHEKLAAHQPLKQAMTVVFSTYHSSDVIRRAQDAGFSEFDLIICDEAHRTTGVGGKSRDQSAFTLVHNQDAVRGKKRLYMTATPRIYKQKSKDKVDVYSMDDEMSYGPTFHKLGFEQAVNDGLLSDYKVLIVALRQGAMSALVNRYHAMPDDEAPHSEAIDTEFATKVIGSWKGLSNCDLWEIDEDGQKTELETPPHVMKRAIAFTSTKEKSRNIERAFGSITGVYLGATNSTADNMADCQIEHVDSGMNAKKRVAAINWLTGSGEENECRIVSNVRCLSEGVDVPNLDAALFFSPKRSTVEIVQAVGRVMRKVEGKRFGYIILTVGISDDDISDYNSYISNSDSFKEIWAVLKALRSHDDSLVDEVTFREKIEIIDGGAKGKGSDDGDTAELDLSALPIEQIRDGVYAAIPTKLGDRTYWSQHWAKNTGDKCRKIESLIDEMIRSDQQVERRFNDFEGEMKEALNSAVNRGQVVAMVAQHIITKPIFEELFPDNGFIERNPVGAALDRFLETLDHGSIAAEILSLRGMYDGLKASVKNARSDKSKQDIVRGMYDTFFKAANPDFVAEKGMIYTPPDIVDFIIRSVEDILVDEFDTSLKNKGVDIIDPFTGTGVFITRLLQSGLIPLDQLEYKYKNEIYANEVVLLAYYIAAINIEFEFHRLVKSDDYMEFEGICFADTFQMYESKGKMSTLMPDNSKRRKKQIASPLRVIMGNPPYRFEKGPVYPVLDADLEQTFTKLGSGTGKSAVSNAFLKAVRWASTHLSETGVVAMVIPNSFMTNSAFDGVRRSLCMEFSSIYLLDLRGNALIARCNTSKTRRGQNIRTGV